jgi:hypothetical protein
MTPSVSAQARQRVPDGAQSGGDSGGGRQAQPRGEAPGRAAPEPGPRAAPQPSREPAPRAAAPSRAPSAERARSGDDGDQRRAEPRGGRPRGDNPQVGRAVPREGPPPQAGRDRDRDRRGSWGGYYGGYNNYYYPRRYYPYGYGGFGLGYFYYDPYSWGPRDYYYDSRFSGYGYGYPNGELRLQVRPRDAEVYVDGYYAGEVDDFDGFTQSLTLEEGPYSIEIVAPGFEPLEFDVRIQPGRKITYRGELLPERRP